MKIDCVADLGPRPSANRLSFRGASLLMMAAMVSIAPGQSFAAGVLVSFNYASPAGTIVVRTTERRLYLVLGDGQALRYKVGVGRANRQWSGASKIVGKYLRPNWEPPSEVRLDRPGLPKIIPGGAPNNPMGAAAMTLSGGQYAIHGTNRPTSIGGFVSYGCIRMYNQDITDLYSRVEIGTPVVVLK